MIDRTLYAVSQDEKKPAHTGELFEIEPDKLTIVAQMCIRDRQYIAQYGVLSSIFFAFLQTFL